MPACRTNHRQHLPQPSMRTSARPNDAGHGRRSSFHNNFEEWVFIVKSTSTNYNKPPQFSLNLSRHFSYCEQAKVFSEERYKIVAQVVSLWVIIVFVL